MEVGDINGVGELDQRSPSGRFKVKRLAEMALIDLRRLFIAIWIPVAVLAGAGFGNFAAFGGDFGAETGKIAFNAASSGVFIIPTGAANLVSGGIDTESFTWGSGVGSPSSSLSFAGERLDGAFPGQPFTLGTISYFNGTVLGGTEAYSVGLRTTLSFSGAAQSFDYDFQLINTPNTDNSLQSADSVLLSNSTPTTSFDVDGTSYALNLAFGSVTGGGFSEVNQFFVLEGGSAAANLIGSITANTSNISTPSVVTPGAGAVPTVVPEPSTVLGGISAGGLILVFLMRRLRRGHSSPILA